MSHFYYLIKDRGEQEREEESGEKKNEVDESEREKKDSWIEAAQRKRQKNRLRLNCLQ